MMSLSKTYPVANSPSIPPVLPDGWRWGHTRGHGITLDRRLDGGVVTLLHLEPCRLRPSTNDGHCDGRTVSQPVNIPPGVPAASGSACSVVDVHQLKMPRSQFTKVSRSSEPRRHA